jgi:hypothetical protein
MPGGGLALAQIICHSSVDLPDFKLILIKTIKGLYDAAQSPCFEFNRIGLGIQLLMNFSIPTG